MAAAAKQMIWEVLWRGEFHGCYRWLTGNEENAEFLQGK